MFTRVNSNQSNKMNQLEAFNFKRMKHLFLIFLKQFEVNEYKILIKFLQLIVDKYNLNPSKLFSTYFLLLKIKSL